MSAAPPDDLDLRLLETLRRRNRELETMVDLGKALTATLELKEVLDVVMTAVGQLVKARVWSLLLVDEGGENLVFEVVMSPAAESLKGQRIPLGVGVAGWVAQHGEPLLIPDVRQDPRFAAHFDEETDFVTRSIVCVPVKSSHRVLGVIELINPLEEESFGDAELRLLSAIADFSAIAIDNARNYRRIQQLVVTDDLTGLYNARHMHLLIEREVDRALRYNSPVSLVFIDLDHFKQVNDTHGHLVGSRLLAQFGHFLRNNIRKVDLAARYGGDEFVLVLPETGKAGALTLCNNLLQRLHREPLRSPEGEPLGVTASFGVATLPDDAASKEELIAVADRVMYEVKAATRDAVRGA